MIKNGDQDQIQTLDTPFSLKNLKLTFHPIVVVVIFLSGELGDVLGSRGTGALPHNNSSPSLVLIRVLQCFLTPVVKDSIVDIAINSVSFGIYNPSYLLLHFLFRSRNEILEILKKRNNLPKKVADFPPARRAARRPEGGRIIIGKL